MREFTFTWSIENMNYSWHTTGQEISSPSFRADPIHNTVWTLILYPRGECLGDYFSLFLNRGVDDGPGNISVNFELSCISAEKSPLHACNFSESNTSFAKNDVFGHTRFMTRLEVLGPRKSLYLPKDTLTVRCRMWINGSNVNASGGSFGLTRLYIERILLTKLLKREIGQETTLSLTSVREKNALMSIDILQLVDSIKVEIKPDGVENIMFCVLKVCIVNESRTQVLCGHESSWLGRPQRELWGLPLVCQGLDTGNEDTVEDGMKLQIYFVYSTGEVTEQLQKEIPYTPRLFELVSTYIYSCIRSGNPSNLPRISQDLWNLYKEQVFCDVELKTQTTSFFAHQFVLCVRSPIFLFLLTRDREKTRTKCCIGMEDVVDDVLGKFLFFLYTDAFEDMEWDAVIGLYYAAEKYRVERLKILCCSYLMQNISHDNVCELLILAERHRDSDLKRRVVDFTVRNGQDIYRLPSWIEFTREQPNLAAQAQFSTLQKQTDNPELYEIILRRCPTVQDQFTAAYQQHIISDIVIETPEVIFHAHKSVLSASSSTLKEKLTEDLTDKPTCVFTFPDLEPVYVARLLVFLYSDSLGDVQWDTAIKLYHAADVYQIQRLKIKCSCFLLENMNTSNVMELLLLAHEHRDVKLKSVVQDYIFLHPDEIFASDKWAEFSGTNVHLASETMRLNFRKKYDLSLHTVTLF